MVTGTYKVTMELQNNIISSKTGPYGDRHLEGIYGKHKYCRTIFYLQDRYKVTRNLIYK